VEKTDVPEELASIGRRNYDKVKSVKGKKLERLMPQEYQNKRVSDCGAGTGQNDA
jgi:hypothetical protein